MPDRFPIDKLLAGLRTAGFEVSIGDRLRTFRLLNVIGTDTSPEPEELQRCLRPLFSSSEEQQERFDDVFARIVTGLGEQQGSTAAVRPVAPHGEDREPAEDRKRLPQWGQIAILAGIIVLAVVALAYWKWDLFRAEPGVNPPVSTGTGGKTGGGGGGGGKATGGTDSKMQLPAQTTGTTGTGTTGSGQYDTPSSPSLGAFIVLLLSLGAITDAVRWLLLRRAARHVAGREPPFDWQRPPDSDSGIFDTPAMQQAVNALRGRLAGERMEVDVRRTIRATVDCAGFPGLRYLGSAQSPEYIALIDSHAPDDHLATYYELLVDELSRKGVAVDVYTFHADPHFCTARDGTSVELVRLRSAQPTAKLLVFSDAMNLADIRTGELAPWVDRELGWDQRGLLLPAIPQPRRLARLSAHFAVERADASGLLRLAQRFSSAAAQYDVPAGDPPLTSSPSVAQVRRVLSADVFRWLTACAAQRSREWNATIALGHIAHPAATENELLELVRLGWFRRGSIPEAVRGELLAILAEDPPLEHDADTAVAQELRRRSAEAPRGSFAGEALIVEAMAHELREGDAVEANVAELRWVDPALVRRDDDLPRLLAPGRAAPPGRWSRLRYHGGFAALGPGPVVYTVLGVALATLAAAGGVVEELWVQEPPMQTDTSSTDTAQTSTDRTGTASDSGNDTSAAGSAVPPVTTTVAIGSLPATSTALDPANVGDEVRKRLAQARLDQQARAQAAAAATTSAGTQQVGSSTPSSPAATQRQPVAPTPVPQPVAETRPVSLPGPQPAASVPAPAAVAAERVREGDLVAAGTDGLVGARMSRQASVSYPAVARVKRIEGIVVMNVLISEMGQVLDVRVIRGESHLNDAAIEAVRRSSFSPGTKDGVRVKSWMPVIIRFKL
jgi:TonB family protein